jgi:cupin fold WbuC family metalloprotein
MIVRFHEHSEPTQRMLNAIEPASYIRPHRHTLAGKHEVVIVLRGKLLVVRFQEDGAPLEVYIISAMGPISGMEIPVGAWHTIISLEPGTVAFEVNSGPYEPQSHKEYAVWAPPEEDIHAGAAYLLTLRTQFSGILPELAARDTIDAEEDEIC